MLEKYIEYSEYIDDGSEVKDYASYLGVSGICQAFRTVAKLILELLSFHALLIFSR